MGWARQEQKENAAGKIVEEGKNVYNVRMKKMWEGRNIRERAQNFAIGILQPGGRCGSEILAGSLASFNFRVGLMEVFDRRIVTVQSS